MVTLVHSSHPSFTGPKTEINKRKLLNDDGKKIDRNNAFAEEDYLNDEAKETSIDQDFVLESLEEALTVQKEKLTPIHPSVTRTLHGLALEYKVRSRYEQSLSCLKEAVELIHERLGTDQISLSSTSLECDDASIDSSSVAALSLTSLSVTSFSASSNSTYNSFMTKCSIIKKERKSQLINEKAGLLLCIGNIHRKRGMVKEAKSVFMEAIEMLSEIGYEGNSPRILMILRILNRIQKSQ